MDNKIKSGKEVLNDFFAEIYNIPNADINTVEVLISLYSENKISERNIQNALDDIIQSKLEQIELDDE